MKVSGVRTLGGRQFWTDHFLHHDWRIQRHFRRGQFRLLDGADRRRCAGTFNDCVTAFRQLEACESIRPMASKVVVLLHGLGDVRRVMRCLQREARRVDDFSVVSMGYASTRQSIADHAEALASVVSHFPRTTTVHFVGYSLGAIVVRHFMGDQIEAGKSLDMVGRMVMIGAPNQGASFAKWIGCCTPMLPAILGTSALQLGRQWPEVRDQLATPPCQFGIIAGCGGRWIPRNPLIQGDNDWIVGVEETKLVGASDFREFPVAHALLPSSPRVVQATLRFLEYGYFESFETMQPLPEGCGEFA